MVKMESVSKITILFWNPSMREIIFSCGFSWLTESYFFKEIPISIDNICFLKKLQIGKMDFFRDWTFLKN